MNRKLDDILLEMMMHYTYNKTKCDLFSWRIHLFPEKKEVKVRFLNLSLKNKILKEIVYNFFMVSLQITIDSSIFFALQFG